MTSTFRFEGGQELKKALDELSQRAARSLKGNALLEAAEPMRIRMSQLAPHAPGAPDLREEIAVSRTRGTDSQEAAVAIGPTKRGYYGSFQEFGTSRHSAQPFARPAFDATTDVVLRTLSDSLWRELAGRGFIRSGVGTGPLSGGPGGGGLL